VHLSFKPNLLSPLLEPGGTQARSTTNRPIRCPRQAAAKLIEHVLLSKGRLAQ
jgi:hypothetical protein